MEKTFVDKSKGVRKPRVKRKGSRNPNRLARRSCCTPRRSRRGKASSFPPRPRPAAMSAWIDSNRGAKRHKRGRKAAYKPAGSAAPQPTAPTKRSQKRKAGADAAPSTPAQPNSVAGTPLRIPYGNKDVAMKLGARYGSAGWYAPPGVDLSAFGERGWL
jgi:DNA topoisomerase III